MEKHQGAQAGGAASARQEASEGSALQSDWNRGRRGGGGEERPGVVACRARIYLEGGGGHQRV